jgi:colicin import membrane protein
MESFASQTRAFLYSLAIHAALILLVWFGVDWLLPPRDAAAAGEPVQATLKVSASELKAAKAAIAKAEKKLEEAPPPQPKPEPRPQDSPVPPQPKPQQQLDRPDTVDQEAISRTAVQPPPQPAPREQEAKHRQEQAELTQDIAKQQEAERKQRLREQYEQIQREREAANRRTKLEEQRMQQLADIAAPAKRTPVEAAPTTAPPGNRGRDAGLLAQYMAALQQTADSNWTNHVGAPERVSCKVTFRQIRGGHVINVKFISCPYDAEGREFVERALMKSDMPYAGFEDVFSPDVTLEFCYPREECER